MVDSLAGPVNPAPGAAPGLPASLGQATNLMGVIQQIAVDAADSNNHDAAVDLFRTIQNKPGVQTSEFYLSVALSAIGFGFQFWPGHENIGGVLMGIAGVAYTLSRGIVKAAALKN
jgi:hypothetical protein